MIQSEQQQVYKPIITFLEVESLKFLLRVINLHTSKVPQRYHGKVSEPLVGSHIFSAFKLRTLVGNNMMLISKVLHMQL